MTARAVKRNRTAIVISPLIGCIFVGILGAMSLLLAVSLDSAFNLSGDYIDLFDRARSTANGWLMGILGTISGMVLALFTFFLFYPFALAIWAPTMGKLPHERIVRLSPYLARGALVGAVICGICAALMINVWVGATESLNWEDAVAPKYPGFALLPLVISASLTGALAGSTVGVLTAWIHYLILRPDLQFGPERDSTVEVFD